MDYADFQPRFYAFICQYCGFRGEEKHQINIHVNSLHRFTTWSKCDECDYATLFSCNLKRQLINEHLRRNVNKDKGK